MIVVYSHDANCLRALSPRNLRALDVPCIPFALTGRDLSDRALIDVAANGFGRDVLGDRFTFIRLPQGAGISPTDTNGTLVTRDSYAGTAASH